MGSGNRKGSGTPAGRGGAARGFAAGLGAPVDGSFWSPFAPTVTAGRLDTDMLLTRTTTPLGDAAAAMLRVLEGRPPADPAAERFT
jgi:hypothetical protein